MRQAYAMADRTPADVNVAEIHDCFTVAELLSYDALDVYVVLEPGEGIKVVDLRMLARPVPQRWLPSRKDIPAAELRRR